MAHECGFPFLCLHLWSLICTATTSTIVYRSTIVSSNPPPPPPLCLWRQCILYILNKHLQVNLFGEKGASLKYSRIHPSIASIHCSSLSPSLSLSFSLSPSLSLSHLYTLTTIVDGNLKYLARTPTFIHCLSADENHWLMASCNARARIMIMEWWLQCSSLFTTCRAAQRRPGEEGWGATLYTGSAVGQILIVNDLGVGWGEGGDRQTMCVGEYW